MYTARVDVNLDEKLVVGLQRATKKQPPKKTLYSLVYVRNINSASWIPTLIMDLVDGEGSIRR